MAVEMVFGRLLGQSVKTVGAPRQMDPADAEAHIERLESAFSQITSVFTARKNLNTVLEHVVRESLTCLRANRSTLFLRDPNSEVLKAQFTHVLSPRYQQVGVAEEKEIAKK